LWPEAAARAASRWIVVPDVKTRRPKPCSSGGRPAPGRRHTTFTRERSKVRSLVRPPLGLNNQRLNELLPRGCAPEKLGHNGGTAFLDGYKKSLHTAPTVTHRLRAQPTRCCPHPEILCLNRRHDRSYALGVRRLTLPGYKVWMAASSREPSRWKRAPTTSKVDGGYTRYLY
jgi:hypothetical protein